MRITQNKEQYHWAHDCGDATGEEFVQEVKSMTDVRYPIWGNYSVTDDNPRGLGEWFLWRNGRVTFEPHPVEEKEVPGKCAFCGLPQATEAPRQEIDRLIGEINKLLVMLKDERDRE